MTAPELLPAQSQSKKARESGMKNKSRVFLWLSIALNFAVAAAALGAGAWFWLNDHRLLVQKVETNQLTASALSSIEDSQMRLLSEQKQLSETQESATQKLETLNNTAQRQDQRIDNIQAQIAALDSANTNDWLIAEADYLTRMAGRKL